MAPDPIQSSADSEDEDLFDFPSVIQAASGAYLGATTASIKAAPMAAEPQATADSVPDKDILGADDLLETLDHIDAMAMEGELPDFDTLTSETPILGEQPAAVDDVPATLPSAPEASSDADLDEDLFGFDGTSRRQLSDDVPSKGNADDDVPSFAMDSLLEESGPELAPLADISGSGSGEDDLILAKTVKTPSRPAPKTSTPLVERSVKPKKEEPRAIPKPAPGRNLDKPAEPQFENIPITNTVMVPMGQDEGRRGRLIEILAIGFLVINTGLVLLAWRAGDQFQETLLSVAHTVGGALNQQPAMASSNPTLVQVVLPPVSQQPAQDPAANTLPDSGSTTPDAPVEQVQPQPQAQPLKIEVHTDLEGLLRMVLDDAITQLENGKPEAARSSLYHMIGNRDRSNLPDDIVDEAEILIARSYQLQGAALKAAQQ